MSDFSSEGAGGVPPGLEVAGPPEDPSRWFAQEVCVHEPSLKAYLRGSCSLRDVDDVVQESYLRVWKAHAAQPIRSARAFLFSVARRLAIDVLRRHRASPVTSVPDIAGVYALEDAPDAAELTSRQERVRLFSEAIAELPARCREVFILHKIKGRSRREVAAELGLAEKTVEVQTARAMKRCGQYLRRRGVSGLFDHETR